MKTFTIATFATFGVASTLACPNWVPAPPPPAWCAYKEISDSYQKMEGYPVWSSAGGDLLAGVERQYDRQLQIPPLQGWVSKRCFKFRPFTQKLGQDSKRVFYDDFQGGNVRQITDTGDYLLIDHWKESNPDCLEDGEQPDNHVYVQQIFRDKTKRELLKQSTDVAAENWVQVITAPTGTEAVLFDCQVSKYIPCPDTDNCLEYKDINNPLCTVKIVDLAKNADPKKVIKSFSLQTNKKIFYDSERDLQLKYGGFRKNSAGAIVFIVSDWSTVAYEVNLATRSSKEVPLSSVSSCDYAPDTTSSRISADGREVYVDGSKLKARTSSLNSFNCASAGVKGADISFITLSRSVDTTNNSMAIGVGVGGSMLGVGLMAVAVVLHRRSRAGNVPDATLEQFAM